MDGFWGVVKLGLILNTVVGVTILVLLAMPKSQFRDFSLTVIGWAFRLFGVLGVLYILNPIDLIPDFIPIVGWVDDAGAFVITVANFFIGQLCFDRKSLPSSEQ